MIHASVGNIPSPSLSLVSCPGEASREVLGTCKGSSTCTLPSLIVTVLSRRLEAACTVISVE